LQILFFQSGLLQIQIFVLFLLGFLLSPSDLLIVWFWARLNWSFLHLFLWSNSFSHNGLWNLLIVKLLDFVLCQCASSPFNSVKKWRRLLLGLLFALNTKAVIVTGETFPQLFSEFKEISSNICRNLKLKNIRIVCWNNCNKSFSSKSKSNKSETFSLFRSVYINDMLLDHFTAEALMMKTLGPAQPMKEVVVPICDEWPQMVKIRQTFKWYRHIVKLGLQQLVKK